MKKKAINISFNSLHEMSDWIERTPRTERGEEYQRSAEESKKYNKFAGTDSFTEADNLLKFGDEENAKKIQAAHANVKATPGVSERNRLYNSPCGFLPIVPRVLAGVPENMLNIRKEEYRSTKVINVIYNTAVDYRVSAKEIIKTSASVASAINTLEKNGYRVNLYAANFTDMRDEPVSIMVKIKDAGQYFDGLRVAYPLVNPSFLRRHIFAVLERMSEIYLTGSYGIVMSDSDAVKYVPKDMQYLSFYKCEGKSVEDIVKLIK